VIYPVIPTHGESLLFTRMIQVDGEDALELNLELKTDQSGASLGGRVLTYILILSCLITGFRKAQKGSLVS